MTIPPIPPVNRTTHDTALPTVATAPGAPGTVWTGLGLCLAASLVGLGLSRLVPVLSALLVAIVLGVVVGNVHEPPSLWQPGISFSARQLLRAGIVVLGLKVSLASIASLGWHVVLLVVAIVLVGVVGSYWIGRLMGMDPEAAMVIAGGCSICGAAAVAAIDGVIHPMKEHVAAAIGIVVLFGTCMIGIVPLVSTVLHLPPAVTAIWAGGGTHEVAQVVAIGGILGGGNLLATAVVVKLARVVMLAPTTVAMGIWKRRSAGTVGSRPPLVQGFVLGFLAMVLVRTLIPLPRWLLDGADVVQTVLLAMAMFALGLGVNRRSLATSSGRSMVLGVLATLLVNAIALGGALLVH